MILNRLKQRKPWLLGSEEEECALCGLRTSHGERMLHIVWPTVSGHEGDTRGNQGRYILVAICDECVVGLRAALCGSGIDGT